LDREEESFILLVMKLLEDRSSPKKVIRKLERIFAEDTEDFVRELWRFLIFEQLKIKYKII
jgi:hypothetical protein